MKYSLESVIPCSNGIDNAIIIRYFDSLNNARQALKHLNNAKFIGMTFRICEIHEKPMNWKRFFEKKLPYEKKRIEDWIYDEEAKDMKIVWQSCFDE